MSLSPEKFEEWMRPRVEWDGHNNPVFPAVHVEELYALLVPRWVPVEERLPEDGEHLVVVWIKTLTNEIKPTIRRIPFYFGKWRTVSDVTHWLDHYIPPLPEVSDAT